MPKETFNVTFTVCVRKGYINRAVVQKVLTEALCQTSSVGRFNDVLVRAVTPCPEELGGDDYIDFKVEETPSAADARTLTAFTDGKIGGC